MSRFLSAVIFCSILAPTFFGASARAQAGAEKQPDGIILSIGNGFLKIQFRGDNVVRIAFATDRSFFDRKSLAVLPPPTPYTGWAMKRDEHSLTLDTAKIKVRVDTASGAVSLLDSAGQPIVAEKQGGRVITPAEVMGEQTFHVQQQWQPNSNESLYGLGENQLGLLDIKGYDLDLWQHNGTDAIPFLVSSRGYGILWDNPSYTRFGDLRPFEPVPAAQLIDANGKAGGLTGSYYSGAHFEKLIATRRDAKVDIYIPGETQNPNHIIHPDLAEGDASVRWEGTLVAPATGDYLFQGFSNDGIKFWIDDRLLMNHWRQSWLPWKDLTRIPLEAGHRYHLKLEWSKDQGGIAAMSLAWKTPSHQTSTSLWSEVGDGVDYYFVYGPKIDNVIAGYRQITGQAPMIPAWAFGLWQSRQRYKTSQESLEVVDGFRSRHIPFDNIVQDWFYWKEAEWGSHQFDPERFPDPQAWINSIHDKHSHLMISVWGKFYPGTANFEAMHSRGFLYEPNLKEGLRDWLGHAYTFYDALNPDARKLFWSQVNRDLFSKHVDAWWMDATEPDLMPTPTLEGQHTNMNPTYLGTGARVLNAYPLMNSEGVYDGQREVTPNQRVFILTRSAYAGQQRYAAATWSGDTSSTWTAMRTQIPAGLGFSISGIPYWTMDVGGFSVPARFSTPTSKPEDAEEWRELNARWFEFGTFVPFLRAHGEYPNREMWFMGEESSPAYRAELKFDRLRYRLLPYVYSLAGDVTQNGSTMMRPLVMDFPKDPEARDISDEYMFGPAFLVAPVTTYKARSRSVYLPRGSWYDLWSGAVVDKPVASGAPVDASAPYDAIPIHVRAGSIIPFGPEIQYTSEKADPITVFVYAGANGSFDLYEDDGLTYNYEKGQFSRIPIRWDDAKQTLTIGEREGSFPEMLPERTFNIVLVSRAHPVAFSLDEAPQSITKHYNGEELVVNLQAECCK
ncbi:MAG TPA: TIM-barrel domain-containing protein [Terriglobia bacterium]|nr:TIM-barrel domain-containing protein [Terriglobia bacterium]